jgi:hypothetical protein
LGRKGEEETVRTTGRRLPWAALYILALCAAALFALPAGADPRFQFSASVGLGEFSAGAGPPRFAVVPTGSFLLLRGERWLLRCDDAVTLLGATGGRFGAANATTLSFGAWWEAVNVSAGLSLAEYSLPLCGARWCGQVRGLAPGVDARLDIFRPEVLRGALGLSASCGTLWIVGVASSVWSGFSTRCTLGPIFRLSSR